MSQSVFDKTIAATDRSGVDAPRPRRNHASPVVLQGAEIGREFRLLQEGRASAMIS